MRNGFSGRDSGLDLGRTKPPVAEIVADFERAYPDSPVLYVVGWMSAWCRVRSRRCVRASSGRN